MKKDFDVIVVGMGPGGEAVASTLAEAGLEVLAVEKKLVGGECPYWGCIPSKIMVRAGNSLGEAARALGLAGNLEIDPEWAPVAARVRGATDSWDDTVAVRRHEENGETVVHGEAKLVAPGAVEVDGDRYTARRGVVLATGGEPVIPPLDGLDQVDFWTNREAIEADELPRELLVLGGGPIGLELAQAFRRFGTDVTVIEKGDHVLSMEEPENGRALGDVLEQEGMRIHTEASATGVKALGARVRVDLSDGHDVEGDRLLVATGRRSDFRRLGLDAVDLDPDSRSIEVDEHMRAGEKLWAIGDITGKGAFTHVSVYQARIAAADILEQPHSPANYDAVPRVTFTDPEIASVGMSEARARENGTHVRTGVSQTSASSRGYIHGPGAEHGVMKVVADADRKILIGASVMGPGFGEIIPFLTLAVREQIPIQTLRDLIYPYPTFVRGLEESLREAAG